MRPALWLAGLLFGLPFYLLPLPLLPGLSLNLVEVGIYGGVVLVAGQLLFRPAIARRLLPPVIRGGVFLLGLLVSVALVATFAYPLSAGTLVWPCENGARSSWPAGLFGLLLA